MKKRLVSFGERDLCSGFASIGTASESDLEEILTLQNLLI